VRPTFERKPNVEFIVSSQGISSEAAHLLTVRRNGRRPRLPFSKIFNFFSGLLDLVTREQ
jgi:hypothetical protein